LQNLRQANDKNIISINQSKPTGLQQNNTGNNAPNFATAVNYARKTFTKLSPEHHFSGLHLLPNAFGQRLPLQGLVLQQLFLLPIHHPLQVFQFFFVVNLVRKGSPLGSTLFDKKT